MAEQNTSNFKEIVRNIENNKILLPDFQRDFVWRDEQMQKSIVASVLAKMPIGSILLLASKPDEYSSKIIGCKKTLDTNKLTDEVDFLLDGQQRITVLSNVFSSIIHQSCESTNDLVAPMALKRRFFLRIPKWEQARNSQDADWFGVSNLDFPMANPATDDPEFLSGQIFEYVVDLAFNSRDDKPYNPNADLAKSGLSTFCVSYPDGYLIPLYLLIPPQDPTQNRVTIFQLGQIIGDIACHIQTDIQLAYSSISMFDEKKRFVNSIVNDQMTADCITMNDSSMDDEFAKHLQMKSSVWASKMKDYLDSCITNLNLHQIRVSSSQRARAIDIYENLNRGGISLSTFDLVMAKVAKVDKQNFLERIISAIQAKRDYPESLIPTEIIASFKKKINYNATLEMGCYNRKKNELNSKYIDIFLDVLGMYCSNPDFRIENFKLEYIKKDKILSLKPEDIHRNCEKAIDAIDRALFFLQVRCGIRSLQEVAYSLMVVLVSIIFLNDKYYHCVEVHKLLEAWHWGILFSGEFDKDQNSRMISNLQSLYKTFETKDISWMTNPDCIISNVMKAQNYSDKALILMDKAADERYPKTSLRTFFCEFMLSRTYHDMYDDSITISTFYENADRLQMHHIIPLGSVKRVGEMNTSSIRNNNSHICNSPVNFVWITDESNRRISDDSLDDYVKKLNLSAKSELFISSYTSVDSGSTDQKIHDILAQRFDNLTGKIQSHLQFLIGNWKISGGVVI